MNSFIMYENWWRLAAAQGDARRQGAFLLAICKYAFDGVVPDPSDGPAYCAYLVAQPIIDRHVKRSAAGTLGGKAKRKQNGSKTEANAKQNGSKTEANAKQNGSNQIINPSGTYNEHSVNAHTSSKPSEDDLFFAQRKLEVPDEFMRYFRQVMDSQDWQARSSSGRMYGVTAANLASVLGSWWRTEQRTAKKNAAPVTGAGNVEVPMWQPGEE